MSLLHVARRSRAVLRTAMGDKPADVDPNSDMYLRRIGVIEALIGDLTKEINTAEQKSTSPDIGGNHGG